MGGLELTTARLAFLLATRGAATSVIAPSGSPLETQAFARGRPSFPLEPRMKYGDVPVALSLLRFARRERIDTLMFFRSQDLHLGALVRMLEPTIRIVFYQQMQSGIAKTDFLHTFVFRRLNAWFTLTRTMRDEVLEWTTMDPTKVSVVPLGRDAQVFVPGKPSRTAARTYFRIPLKAFVIGLVGRLDRQKGQRELIQALPEVMKQVPQARVMIVGDETKDDPGMRSELEALVTGMGLGSVVRIMPPTSDVNAFLSAVDLFVMPSHSETYGLVLLEAMAKQLPVIATRSGGVPDLVRDGVSGLLVEPKNVEQLSHAIIRLASDPQLRSHLSAEARKRFMSTFVEDRCIDTLLEALEDLTS
jgi:glycosyltransferase involved in cell wall biosynthesis